MKLTFLFEFNLLSFVCFFDVIQVHKVEETSELLITSVNVEKNELALSLNKEKLQTLQLKQELVDAETRNADLYKVFFFFLINVIILYFCCAFSLHKWISILVTCFIS